MNMHLNGWTRIWIVISLVWIAIATFLALNGLSELYGKTKALVGRNAVAETKVVFSKAQAAEAEALVNEKWIPAIERQPDKYLGKEITEPYDQYIDKHGLNAIGSYIVLIFLPPLGLFVGGWSVAWVRRGFAEKHPQSGKRRHLSGAPHTT